MQTQTQAQPQKQDVGVTQSQSLATVKAFLSMAIGSILYERCVRLGCIFPPSYDLTSALSSPLQTLPTSQWKRISITLVVAQPQRMI